LIDVLKETFRLDPTTIISSRVQALKDTEICGVPIPKGSFLELSLVIPQNSQNDWHKPNEFIPERFNADSEYFNKPGSNKLRSVYSYIPFAHGPRTCPGKTLGTLLSRVCVMYFMSYSEIEISKEQIENEGIGFGVGCKFNLEAQVDEIKEH
jgi:cytochrome P450